jgi:hypothetical protein
METQRVSILDTKVVNALCRELKKEKKNEASLTHNRYTE